MTNSIEIYLRNSLLDISTNLSITLEKQLINLSSLTSKESTYSYSCSFPKTDTNIKAFDFSSIYETTGKFNKDYEAKIYCNSSLIFDGNFKLSEITETAFKGNFYIKAKTTISDIFNTKKLVDCGQWIIPFKDLWEDLEKYNSLAKNEPQDCCFPYILYGLLPKAPYDPFYKVNGNTVGAFTDKDLWDEWVRLGIEDFPPAINCLRLIKKLFENEGLEIGGSAFDDDGLRNVYMSYKNDPSFEQPWNWGRLAQTSFGCKYKSGDVTKVGNNNYTLSYLERHFFVDGGGRINTYDLTNSHTNFTNSDLGTNLQPTKDTKTYTGYTNALSSDTVNHLQYTVPKSGFYRMTLEGKMRIQTLPLTTTFLDKSNDYEYAMWRFTNNDYMSDIFNAAPSMYNHFFEMKVLRDYGEDDFGLDDCDFDARFWGANMNNKEDQIEAYMPINKSLMLIDPAQNERYLMGFRWGKGSRFYSSDWYKEDYRRDPIQAWFSGETMGYYCNIKDGWSVDSNFTQKERIYCMYNGGTYNHRYYNSPNQSTASTLTPTSGDVTPQVVFGTTNKFSKTLLNAPRSFVTQDDDGLGGSGKHSIIVWLNKGEHLKVVATVPQCKGPIEGALIVPYEYTNPIEAEYNLTLELVTENLDWYNGTSNNWNYKDTVEDKIDLMQFLERDITAQDYINSITQTFGLELKWVEGKKYTLDVVQNRLNKYNNYNYIDIDNRCNLVDATFKSLDLPARYKLAFSILENEIGGKLNGSIEYETNSITNSSAELTSKFAHTTFKTIRYSEYNRTPRMIELPIISEEEPWKEDVLYNEGMKKFYTNKAHRLFLPKELLSEKLGGNKIYVGRYNQTDTLLVSDRNSSLVLTYEDEPNSISNKYFTVMQNAEGEYVEIKTYITPIEYQSINGNTLIKLNGDLWFVSKISGYNLTTGECKLVLIRKVS